MPTKHGDQKKECNIVVCLEKKKSGDF